MTRDAVPASPGMMVARYARLMAVFAWLGIVPFAPTWSTFVLLFAALPVAGYTMFRLRASGQSLCPPCRSSLAWAMLALMVWGCVSAFWSLRPIISVEYSATIALILLAAFVICADWLRTNQIRMAIIRLAAPIVPLVCGLLLIEMVSQGWGIATIYLSPGSQAMNRLQYYNQAGTMLAILVFLAWPLARQAGWSDRACAGLTLLVAGCVLSLESETAKLAMASGVVTWVAVWILGKWAWLGAVSVLLVVWMSAPFWLSALTMWLRETIPIPLTLASRFELWDYIITQIHSSPQQLVLGSGMRTTRFLPRDPSVFSDPSYATHLLHPHNAVLQIWVEMGAVGAAIGCAVTVLLFRAAYRLAPHHRGWCCASLAAAFTNAAAAYGIWQPQWVATLAMAAILAGVVSAQHSNAERQ